MSRPELNETLTALVGAVPMDGATTMVEVDLDVPMEISLSHRDGALVIHAAPGSTRFVNGLLPVVHNTRLVIVASDAAQPARPWPAGWSG